MTLPNGSASGAERMLACPASLVLPHTIFRSTDYADRGHGLHGFNRNVLTGIPKARALELLGHEHQEVARRIDFQKVGGDLSEVQCEVAYALNFKERTSRVLGLDIGRHYERYGITLDELPGSNDLQGIRWDLVPVVLDLKFGWEQVPPPAENIQMKVYVTSRAWLTGEDLVEGRIVKFDPSGDARVYRHEFDRLELDLFGDEIEEGAARVRAAERVYLAGGMPTVATGTHCRWCQSMSFCPAYTRLAKTMAGDLGDIEARLAELTPVERGQAYLKSKQVRALLERVKDGLDALAIQEPFPTTDGKEVRASSYDSRSFDQAASLALLRDKGATDAEIDSLYTVKRVESVRELNVPGRPKKRAKKAKAPAIRSIEEILSGVEYEKVPEWDPNPEGTGEAQR